MRNETAGNRLVIMIRFITGPIIILLLLLTMLLGGLSVVAFWGDDYWLFDLMSHFRVQYAIGLSACFLAFSLFNARSGAVLALLLVLVNLVPMVPFYWNFWEPAPEVSASHKPFKVVQMNVWGRNQSCVSVANYLLNVKPALVSLVEVTSQCRQDLAERGVLKLYPYSQLAKPTRLLLLCQTPLKHARVQYVEGRNGSTIVAETVLNHKPLTVLMAHTTRPQSEEAAENQNAHFDELITLVNAQKQPVILLGDLNTTPFSSAYRQLMRETVLHDSQERFGLQPSWPAKLYILPGMEGLSPLIPIDHVLVSPEFTVLSRRVGPEIGSDHLPVTVELGL